MRTILFILSLFMIISCDKPNDNKQQEQHNDLYGSWDLKVVKGYIDMYAIYTNEIEWRFDEDSLHVSMVNGMTSPPPWLPRNNGTYSYTLHNRDSIYIFHDGQNHKYRYQISNDTLELLYYFDNVNNYGYEYTFKKIN